MLSPLAGQMQKLGVHSQILTGLGTGSIDSHVEKAVHKLSRTQPLHLIGHSMGGLIARALALRPELNVAAVTTLATPHHGAVLADVIGDLKNRSPRLYRFMQAIGYNFDQNSDLLTALGPQAMRVWNTKHPNQKDVDYASFEFSVSANQLSPPVRFVFAQIPRDLRPVESDGYVERNSQRWGSPLGHFALDHLSQMGWNFHCFPALRSQFQSEFQAFTLALKTRILQF
jgi:triacylglycerol lipase